MDTAVMIDGEEHQVKISDPRLLEMMNLVGEATEEEPLEILDAAAEAGIELESYGEMLEEPTQARAGDAVISTKGSGFYLGKGEVLLESGEVVPLSEVLELRPPQSGIFRLELPELPDDVDHSDGGDQEPEDTAEPSEGGEAPPAEDGASAEGEPAEPAAPAEGGAAREPAPEVAPEVLPDAGFEAGAMPNPAIAPEFEDLDGDAVPDDNNANGMVDELEPLPEAPVAEEPAPAPEAPEPVEEAPAPAPEDQEPEPEQSPEPIFEGSASLDLDSAGLRATGEATARISDVPFEGEALGSQERR
ncbi:hypothetical protein BJF89_11595 [Corynebacterium sp. CNJ-954]|uniref:hypothetical protein n=1 Tax=Corynebacterium sp. CNJ-954 TaxID=1904962 RepID=UPI000962DDFB|nr:hypothetical protein [Corynebacterium sp. CNJ-954]OLT50057.1 hypothetical protein BJF89_11595 [Corynebacterium sp. CNJ-954]